MFEGYREVSATLVKEIAEKDASFLLSMDKRFKLEKALIDHMVDGGGEQLTKDMITKALPSDTATIDVNKSVAEITKIKTTSIYAWVSPGMQAIYHNVLDRVKAIQGKKKPPSLTSNDPFVDCCLTCMSKWCTLDVPQGAVSAPGKPRAQEALQHFQNMEKDGKGIPYRELQDLVSFSWLLTAAETAFIHKCMENAAKSVKVSSPSESSSAKPTSAKAAVRGKREPTAKVQVASLFKKR